jgi:PKD repeat protein
MKKLFLLGGIALSLILRPSTLSAQFTVGSNDGSNTATAFPTPIFDYYKTSKAQYLYLASEMIAAGMSSGFIDELSWNVVAIPAGTGPTEGYSLKMKATNSTSLGLTTWEAGASLVYGPADYTPVLGTNNFVLDDPFYWDGVSNLIVEVCGGDDNGDYTKNTRVSWTGPLGFNASRTYASDTDIDPCSYAGAEYEIGPPGGPTYRPMPTFGLSVAVNCNELPIIGPTNASSTTVCLGETFTLSIGAVAELGINYSWSYSPNGVTWFTIPGATSANYSTTQTENTFYRCTVSCAFSGDNSNSIPVAVTMAPETECYCIPSYILGTVEGDFISHVVLGDIDNATGASLSPYYNYYSDLTTDLVTGETYTLSLTVGDYESSNGIAAWIDFNQNGDFDPIEKLGEATDLAAYTTVNFSFIPPAGSVPGTTRLRVRDVYDLVGIDPCLGYEYGETEDYNVNIIAGIPPVALFSFTGDPTVTFTDLSTGDPDEWHWDFGDGGSASIPDVVHTYETNGVYNACLTVSGILGTDTECHEVTIDTYLAPVAGFTHTGDPVVNFTDLSANAPSSWNWTFGDGFFSTGQNPEHTYASDGSYYVCLTATNMLGSNTVCDFVDISGNPEVPVADFSFTGDPTVAFTDLSTNIPTAWAWDFDDGGVSTEANPTHTFISDGTYSVCLTASNAAGSSEVCKTIVISSFPAPDASFSYVGDPDVAFTDLSTGGPTTWLWNFDDGDVSTEQNPTHDFASNGVFNVCLSVTAPGGSDTYCQDITISENPSAPVADYSYEITGYNVEFTDLSTNEPDDWYWNFDDGNISGLQNPAHEFVNPGTYNVCLRVTNEVGFTEICKQIGIAVGINQESLTNIEVYPNPTTESLNITIPNLTEQVTLEVINALGQKVATPIIVNGINYFTLDVKSLAAGTYIISVHNSTIFGTTNFVKQ